MSIDWSHEEVEATVADDGWLDELHPKISGFNRIARKLAA